MVSQYYDAYHLDKNKSKILYELVDNFIKNPTDETRDLVWKWIYDLDLSKFQIFEEYDDSHDTECDYAYINSFLP